MRGHSKAKEQVVSQTRIFLVKVTGQGHSHPATQRRTSAPCSPSAPTPPAAQVEGLAPTQPSSAAACLSLLGWACLRTQPGPSDSLSPDSEFGRTPAWARGAWRGLPGPGAATAPQLLD